jgi:hypothetical protein
MKTMSMENKWHLRLEEEKVSGLCTVLGAKH